MITRRTTADIRRARLLRELHELIDAIDRRLPQVHRAGEVAIANAAATLRNQAEARINELERLTRKDSAAVSPPPSAS